MTMLRPKIKGLKMKKGMVKYPAPKNPRAINDIPPTKGGKNKGGFRGNQMMVA